MAPEEALPGAVRTPLSGPADPVPVARWLRGLPGAAALSGDWCGGGMILSSHPAFVAEGDDDPFATLDRLPGSWPGGSVGEPGPGALVGGGWIGWLGSGLARRVEALPPAPPAPDALPDFSLAFHDHLVRCDTEGRWFFEALVTPERAAFLAARLEWWRGRLARPLPAALPFRGGALRPTGAGLAGHHAAVAQAIARIAAGDHAQANICLRLEAGLMGDPLDIWVRGVAASRPAHAAYLSAGEPGAAVVSFSPELFLRRTGREVMTRPIKGTAPAAGDPQELIGSAKDRAENVMIVDLMRNDLGRVCEFGSVRVPALCALRAAPGVWHLESEVRGCLRVGMRDSDLLRASFPPGSVTGAPKVQALRTIHELEGTARGVAFGAIGIVSPLAGLELSVAIRTLEIAEGRIGLGVGGGVVADSTPEGEVREALVKARAVADAAGLRLGARASRPRQAGMTVQRAFPRPDPARGVFETIRVLGGDPVFLADHLRRLEAGASAAGLTVPPALAARIREHARGVGEGGVRVTLAPSVTRVEGVAPRAGRLLELVPVVLPGGLGAHKWLDRRLIDGYTRQGRVPLICDIDGTVLEAGHAAVLAVVDGRLVVPPRDGRRLASVSLAHLLEGARAAGWPVVSEEFGLAELGGADAVVLCSTLRGPHLGVLGSAVGAEAERLLVRLRGVWAETGAVSPREPARSRPAPHTAPPSR